MKTWSVSSRRPLGTLLAVALCAALALSISATGAAGKGGKCAKGAEAPGCTLPEGTRFYKGLGDSAAITVEVGPKGVALTAYAVPIKCTKFAPMLGDEGYVVVGLSDKRHPKVGKSYLLKESVSRQGEDGKTESAVTEVTLEFKTAKLLVVKLHQVTEVGGEVGCDGSGTWSVKRQS